MGNLKVDDDLRTLGRCKDYISKILFNSDDVRNLTMPILDDDRFDALDNFFGGSKLEYHDKSTNETLYVDLLGHCFDVPYIVDTITETPALITMESYATRMENEHIKEIEIDIYAFAHKDHIHMNPKEKSQYSKRGYSGNRVDMMCSAIWLALKDANRPKDFGIGKINFNPRNPITPYQPNNSFYGKRLSFLCSDFFVKPKNQR